MKKILIIRFSSIGDIVLTSPIARCLKLQLKDNEIHFLTKENYKSIVENNPYIDKVHTINTNASLTALAFDLRKENYDYIVDLHSNLRSLVVKIILKKPSKAFDKLNFKKWLLVHLKINKLPNIHIVERYFKTLQLLDVKNDDKGLDFFIPETDVVDLEWLPIEYQNGFSVLVIGGQHYTKKLPTIRLIELCDKINQPIILLGGKEDKLVGDEIENAFEINPYTAHLKKEFKKKTIVFNACGKFNLNQSASLLQQSQIVYTHDTGLMHIAAAFKKDIYSIWGNTIPEFGMYPYQTKFKIWEVKNLDCRPCSKIGFQKCPKGHFNCMNKIKFDF